MILKTRLFFWRALLNVNELKMTLTLVLSVINHLVWSALIVTGSIGQRSVKLFSGLVLFLVITVQVAAVKKTGQQNDPFLSFRWRVKEKLVCDVETHCATSTA